MVHYKRRVGAVLLAVLVLTSVFAVSVVAVDEIEQNDSQSAAQAVTPGTTINAQITPTDEDWFRFEAEAGQEVVVTLTKDPGFNTELTLALFDEQRQVSQESVGAAVATATVSDTTTDASAYFVQVRPNGASTTNYTLDIALRDTEVFEPNDDRKHATPLESGVPLEGAITANDEDWFTFDVETGQEATVTLTKEAGSDATATLVLYDPDQQVDSEFVSGSELQEAVADTADISTTYYVQIRPSSNSRFNYTVALELRDTVGVEPNENKKTATVVTSTDPIEGEISANDDDWYTFDVVAGQPVVVTVTKSFGTDTRLNVWLEDPDGRVDSGFLSDTQTTLRLEDVPEVNTTYYVHVWASGSDVRTTYTLEAPATAVPPADDDDDDGPINPDADPELEPNDDFGTAMAVTNDSLVAGSISDGDADVFSVVADVDDELTVTFDRERNDSVSMVVIYGPGGTWVTATVVGSGMPVVLETTADSSGLYYVQVAHVSGDSSNYELGVLVETPPAPVPPAEA